MKAKLTLFTTSFVFLFGSITLAAVTQLTHNAYDDYAPQIHQGQVSWYGWDGQDYEIFFYDGASTTQITNNDYGDINPDIHGGQITWQGWDGNDYEIFIYRYGSTTQLTNNDYDDQNPKIHNGQVAWEGYDGDDWEIFLYNGVSILQLINNTRSDVNPQIHDGKVTWSGYTASHGECIYLYNGDHTQSLECLDNKYPQIHNGQVTWVAERSTWDDSEIQYYDGSSAHIITYNDYEDIYPQIYNGKIVWQGKDGADFEIFFYDGNTKKLTDNSYDDINPQIHSSQVVWEGYDGQDYEIFLYAPDALAVDIDGNGQWDALTDGILILRYLFGFRGATLIEGAVAPDCTRCTAAEIEECLEGFLMP